MPGPPRRQAVPQAVTPPPRLLSCGRCALPLDSCCSALGGSHVRHPRPNRRVECSAQSATAATCAATSASTRGSRCRGRHRQIAALNAAAAIPQSRPPVVQSPPPRPRPSGCPPQTLADLIAAQNAMIAAAAQTSPHAARSTPHGEGRRIVRPQSGHTAGISQERRGHRGPGSESSRPRKATARAARATGHDGRRGQRSQGGTRRTPRSCPPSQTTQLSAMAEQYILETSKGITMPTPDWNDPRSRGNRDQSPAPISMLPVTCRTDATPWCTVRSPCEGESSRPVTSGSSPARRTGA